MVTYPFNPSTQEAKAGQQCGSQSWLHSKILPQKHKANEIYKKRIGRGILESSKFLEIAPLHKNLSVQNILLE